MQYLFLKFDIENDNNHKRLYINFHNDNGNMQREFLSTFYKNADVNVEWIIEIELNLSIRVMKLIKMFAMRSQFVSKAAGTTGAIAPVALFRVRAINALIGETMEKD